MKFYCADWRSDPALRLCSRAARGTWIDMISIMHEAEPYGELKVNGIALDARSLAKLLGEALADIQSDLAELEAHGVFSRRKNGVIYSRRMERDENRKRKLRENGKKGGNPNIGNNKGNRPLVNQGDNPQIPEARYQKPESDPSSLRSEGESPSLRSGDLHTRENPPVLDPVAVEREEAKAMRGPSGQARQRQGTAPSLFDQPGNGAAPSKGDIMRPLPDAFADAAGMTPVEILSCVIDRERAAGLVQFRAKVKKPMVPRAAWLMAQSLKEIERRGGSPAEAADMTLERGWQSIKPDWYFNSKKKDIESRSSNGGGGYRKDSHHLSPRNLSGATLAMIEIAQEFAADLREEHQLRDGNEGDG